RIRPAWDGGGVLVAACPQTDQRAPKTLGTAVVNRSRFSSTIEEGGERYTSDPNGRTKTPSSTKRARKPSRSSMRSSSTTPIAPFTRTSLTAGRSLQDARPRSSALAMAATCCRRGSDSNRSSEALAAAQASGFALKVGPCISACMGSSDQNLSKTRAHATVAASGSVPPVNAFESVTISGTTSAASHANRGPVAPEAGEALSKKHTKRDT